MIALVPQECTSATEYSVIDFISFGRTPYLNVFERPSKEDYNLVYKYMVENNIEHLKNKIDGRMIEKERYLIPLQEGQKIELDIFHGYLEGLVFAEVEFQSIEEAEAFLPPDWFLEDVSLDKRYNNSYLSKIECWE